MMKRVFIFMYSNNNRADILQRMLPSRANDPKRQTRPKIAVQELHKLLLGGNSFFVCPKEPVQKVPNFL